MAEYEFLRAGNSEATEKKGLNALFDPASGVLSGLVVTQTSTASGSVLIASGSALVHTSAVSASLLGNDTSKTLDVFTANPVGGLPRNDIVEFDQITASIIVHVGTPNATPTDPTVPNTSVALSRLRHAASATTIPTAKIDTLIVTTTLRQPAMPHARFTVGTGGSRAASTWQAAQLNGVADASGTIGTVSGYQVVITDAGLYNLEGSVSMSAGTFAVRILVSSTVLTATPIGSGASLTASASATRRLNAGDTIQLQVYPTVTLTVDSDGGTTPSCLSITRLSD